MKPIDKTAATARVLPKLKSQFGKLVHEQSAEGPVVVDFPSHDFPVQVYSYEGPPGAVLRVCCAVSKSADWSDGLAEYLLRESSDLLIGSVARRGEGIAVEQVLIGNVATDTLGATVFTIAHFAARLQRDLTLMGALTTPDAASKEDPGP